MWRHSWKVHGKSDWTISGHSRALERTGFFIEELRIMLDAGVGWREPTSSIDAVLLTHGHIDHCNALPMVLRCGDCDPAVFVPRSHVNNVREMCRMTWSVKRRDGSAGAGARCDATTLPEHEAFRRPTAPGGGADGSSGGLPPLIEGAGLRDWAPEGKLGRLWVPVEHGCQFLLPGKRPVVVKTVKCFHSTQDIGYVVCESLRTQRGRTPALQEEFERLKAAAKAGDRTAGHAIARLRKEGDLVMEEEVVGRVAYLFDTTAQVLGPCARCAAAWAAPPCLEEGHAAARAEAAALAAGPRACAADDEDSASAGSASAGQDEGGDRSLCEFTDPSVATPFSEPCTALSSGEMAEQAELIFSCPTIMVECSFIGAAGMSDAEADTEAIRRTHTSWGQLRPHVESHPGSTFLLAHFSKRYRDEDIRAYFAQEKAERGGPTNVVLWLDSGVVDVRGL